MAAGDDIWAATAGRSGEATDRLTTAVILEMPILVLTRVSISNSQTGRVLLADVGCCSDGPTFAVGPNTYQVVT
jgi:hypothetical protein